MGSSARTRTCLESTWGWPSTNRGLRESPERTSHDFHSPLPWINRLKMKTLFGDPQMTNSRFRQLLESVLVTKTRKVMVLATDKPSRTVVVIAIPNITYMTSCTRSHGKERVARRGFSTASAVISSSQKPIHVSLSQTQLFLFPKPAPAAPHIVQFFPLGCWS